ncbi:MAG: hypothetical protein H8E21_03320 [Gammaproteobacteria bacterium]|nr:hypothetical protein [Gammaproteobacteria bacterium]MBL7000230.1 hypothetical protein [Gammaproteobacteria bacterium]
MIQLNNSLQAVNSKDFQQIFSQEVLQLALDLLPLQQGLQFGSHALTDNIQIMVNTVRQQQDELIVTTGIFYSSIIAGCNCADDPTPVDLNNEYCEVEFSINRHNADTRISLI